MSTGHILEGKCEIGVPAAHSARHKDAGEDHASYLAAAACVTSVILLVHKHICGYCHGKAVGHSDKFGVERVTFRIALEPLIVNWHAVCIIDLGLEGYGCTRTVGRLVGVAVCRKGEIAVEG